MNPIFQYWVKLATSTIYVIVKEKSQNLNAIKSWLVDYRVSND